MAYILISVLKCFFYSATNKFMIFSFSIHEIYVMLDIVFLNCLLGHEWFGPYTYLCLEYLYLLYQFSIINISCYYIYYFSLPVKFNINIFATIVFIILSMTYSTLPLTAHQSFHKNPYRYFILCSFGGLYFIFNYIIILNKILNIIIHNKLAKKFEKYSKYEYFSHKFTL